MTDVQPPATAWVAAFAGELGLEAPTDAEFEVLLELAAVAAHASERIAAPLACWLAGRAGMTPADALAAARTVVAPPP